ncbi:tRNA exportin [Trypanosoma theileri]|uniref:Exportin-T n=1 Tax=Trypanosoma theileri TaxID=67003 RepID=A0A1X0NK00_9TRYP|nr:tRNA exportin [Trypanosoma theileri]ORC85006.1 tRNA exportin [Trypanosoma theileri]
MLTPTSTNHFTRAMEITHMFHPGITQQQRREAESYLMALRATAEGLNLSFHIISNEPLSDVRCCWAFNTIMHHLPSLASGISDEQAGEVYRTLFSFIYRFFFSCTAEQRQPMEFLANKHAQMMVAGLQVFFPSRWRSFFDDAFELLARSSTLPHVSDAVTVYVLRLFEYIDERVVSVRSRADRGREQRARDMELKDAMREHVMPRAVSTWYVILCNCRLRAPEIVRICLSVVQTYIEWVDVTLFITADWINLLYFLVTTPAVRDAACECIYSLVEKKQQPAAKMESLRTLNIIDSLPRIVSLLLQVPPETEEDVNSLEVTARLVRAVAEQLLSLYDHISTTLEEKNKNTGNTNNLNLNSQHQEQQQQQQQQDQSHYYSYQGNNTGNDDGNNTNTFTNPNYTMINGKNSALGTLPSDDGNFTVESLYMVRTALDNVLEQLLLLLSLNNNEVSNALLPFVHIYIKSTALREEQALQLLPILYNHTVIRGASLREDLIWCDEVIDQRKQLHTLTRLLFRRYGSLVKQHLQMVVKRAAGIGGENGEGEEGRILYGNNGVLNGNEATEGQQYQQQQQGHFEGVCSSDKCVSGGSNNSGGVGMMSSSNISVGGGGNCNSNSGNSNTPEEIEAALRYFYELGEYIRMENLRDAKNEYSELLSIVLSSEYIAQCPSPVVHISYFEVFDRYYAFFVYHKEYIPLLLQRLLLLPHGVTNRHPRVRARICYLFAHLVQLLKGNLLPHKHDIVSALYTIFSSDVLLPNDRRELYEATGNLLSVMQITSPAGTANEGEMMIVQVTQSVVQNLRDVASAASLNQVSTSTSSNSGVGGDSAYAELVADAISFLSALAKGLRGNGIVNNDATLNNNNNNNNSNSNSNTNSPNNNNNNTINSISPVDAIAADIFHGVTREVVNVLVSWHASVSVRERAAQYFTQMVHTLPYSCIAVYAAPYLTHTLGCISTPGELARLLRLLLLLVHRSGGGGRAAELLNSTLPALLPHIAANIGGVQDDSIQPPPPQQQQPLSPSQLNLQLQSQESQNSQDPQQLQQLGIVGGVELQLCNVISESARERREVYRQLFAVLHGATQAGCTSVLLALPHSELTPLLQQLLAALYLTGEADLPKLALQIMTKMTQAAAENTNNNNNNSNSNNSNNNNNNQNNNNSNNNNNTNHHNNAFGSNTSGGGGGGNTCVDSSGNCMCTMDMSESYRNWLLFMLNDAVPTILRRFLSPAFDVRDAKNLFLIGESGNLLKALMRGLGPYDSSLCVLLYTTLQSFVGAEEAAGLVKVLQDESAGFSMEMKMRFRNMLQKAKEQQGG